MGNHMRSSTFMTLHFGVPGYNRATQPLHFYLLWSSLESRVYVAISFPSTLKYPETARVHVVSSRLSALREAFVPNQRPR